MFFESWTGIARVIVVGTLAYLALVVALRIAGKRTLSKLNAFDLVVTVALGSTLATVLISKDVPLAEGVLAFVLLIALQFTMAWSSVRSQTFEGLIKSEPTLLVRDGQPLDAAMRRQRITHEEVMAAIRASGATQWSQVGAAILETDGSISIIRAESGSEAGYPAEGSDPADKRRH